MLLLSQRLHLCACESEQCRVNSLLSAGLSPNWIIAIFYLSSRLLTMLPEVHTKLIITAKIKNSSECNFERFNAAKKIMQKYVAIVIYNCA